MKTRNQLSTRTALTKDETNQANDNIKDESISIRSPSPPRLRDRRTSGTEYKPQIPANTSISNGQSSSPPAGVKRISTGPTRILPKRTCGKSNSLLASAVNSLVSSKSKSLSNNRLQAGRKEDAQETQRASSDTPAITVTNPLESESSLLLTSKTASQKNYSKDSLIQRDTLPRHDNGDSTSSNECSPKSKLVRISLPDNTCAHSIDANADAHDMNRYIFTHNGLQQIGTIHADANELTIRDDFTIVGDKRDNLSLLKEARERVFNVLLGVTGSVATIKLLELIQKIKSIFPKPYISKTDGLNYRATVQIKIVMTTNSKHFAPKQDLVNDLDDPSVKIYDDNDEWDLWNKMGDPVLHIELRKWADLCLIAPVDANTIAKLANGICDNLLTCIVRAWDVSKPLVYCPAMNVHMYNHPITREQLSKLQSYGYLRVDCVEKRLACGDVGLGGMATVESITNKVIECLFEPVTRKVSLSKPILNQQPTYPITPTSGSQDVSCRAATNLSTQILNRFKTNNQITIHAVPSAKSNGLSSKQNRGLMRKTGNSSDSRRDERMNANQHTGSSKSNYKTSSVRSVSNLCAIGLEHFNLDPNEEPDNTNDEDPRYDFDPTRLLVQTMITDESISVEHGHKSVKTTEASHNVDRKLPVEAGQSKPSGLTPLFNTSKFLSLCQNKDRGCYTCAICKHDYKNRKSMARHFKEQHVQGNIYHCKPCNVSYKRREKLIKHNRERHTETE